MRTKDGLIFEITGSDYDTVKRFEKLHESCNCGMTGDKLEYCFVPTSLGLLTVVECSCGQKLSIGDLIGPGKEFEEKDYPPLSKKDKENKAFEKQAKAILLLKDPKLFRLTIGSEQRLDILYAYAFGVARFGDFRIRKALTYKYSTKHTSGDEKGNIDEFFKAFEHGILKELEKYDCTDEQLLKMLPP